MLQWYCLSQSFIINNTVYCSSEFWESGIMRLFNPIAQVTVRGFPQLSPISWRSTSSCSGCKFWFSLLLSFFVLSNGGYEVTLLQVAWVPLLVGGSIPHQRGRQMLSFLLTQGYLPVSLPPLFVWSCLPWPSSMSGCIYYWGSLSTSINGHWCCSLCLTYMFLLRSAATSHYLRSSPIFCGCSGRHPWQKS